MNQTGDDLPVYAPLSHQLFLHDVDEPNATATIRRQVTALVARSRVCMYIACMPNVQVRDVPVAVHEALVRRAELAGQSLQQFLAGQLAAIAATPSVEEVLDRIERRSKGRLSAEEAVAYVRDERARR